MFEKISTYLLYRKKDATWIELKLLMDGKMSPPFLLPLVRLSQGWYWCYSMKTTCQRSICNISCIDELYKVLLQEKWAVHCNWWAKVTVGLERGRQSGPPLPQHLAPLRNRQEIIFPPSEPGGGGAPISQHSSTSIQYKNRKSCDGNYRCCGRVESEEELLLSLTFNVLYSVSCQTVRPLNLAHLFYCNTFIFSIFHYQCSPWAILVVKINSNSI